MLKNWIFKLSLTIFPDTVQSGTVSKMGPVSPTCNAYAEITLKFFIIYYHFIHFRVRIYILFLYRFCHIRISDV
jgi:hypothetical protein